MDVGKPKKKVGLVIGGVLMLVVALGGGVWGYTQFNASTDRKVVLASPQPLASIDPRQVLAQIPEINAINGDRWYEDTKITNVDTTKCKGKGKGKCEVSYDEDGVHKIITTETNTNSTGVTTSNTTVTDNSGKTLVDRETIDDRTSGKLTTTKSTDVRLGADGKTHTYITTYTYDGESANPTLTYSLDGIDYDTTAPPTLEALNSQCLPGDDCPISCASIPGGAGGWTQVTEPGGGSYCAAGGKQCSRYRVEKKNNLGTHCFLYYGEQCGEEGSCGAKTVVV
jgi:hypothetical protein